MGSSPIATGATKPLIFDLLANSENAAGQLTLAQEAFKTYAETEGITGISFEGNGYVANCILNGEKKLVRFQHQIKGDVNGYNFHNLNTKIDYIVILRTDPEGKTEGNMCEITENNINAYNNKTKQFADFGSGVK